MPQWPVHMTKLPVTCKLFEMTCNYLERLPVYHQDRNQVTFIDARGSRYNILWKTWNVSKIVSSHLIDDWCWLRESYELFPGPHDMLLMFSSKISSVGSGQIWTKSSPKFLDIQHEPVSWRLECWATWKISYSRLRCAANEDYAHTPSPLFCQEYSIARSLPLAPAACVLRGDRSIIPATSA